MTTGPLPDIKTFIDRLTTHYEKVPSTQLRIKTQKLIQVVLQACDDGVDTPTPNLRKLQNCNAPCSERYRDFGQ
jgi:hypothetical protein